MSLKFPPKLLAVMIAVALMAPAVPASALAAEPAEPAEPAEFTASEAPATSSFVGATQSPAELATQPASPAESTTTSAPAAQSEPANLEPAPSDAPVAPTPPNPVPMYRLYNIWNGEHFYTADVAERDHLSNVGWFYEGVGWVAPDTSATPVYRLYNPFAGDHHYTKNAQERDELVPLGWRDEGIGWYSADEATTQATGKEAIPLYRQYNPFAVAGTHNYTTSAEENDNLISLGWRAEGVAWSALEGGTPDSGTLNSKHWQGLLANVNGGGIKVVNGSITDGQRARMQAVIDRGKDVGFIAVNTRTGKCIAYNADQKFYSASAIKAPFVAALCRYKAPGIETRRAQLYSVVTHSSNSDFYALEADFGKHWLNYLSQDAGLGDMPFDQGHYMDITARSLARLWAEMTEYIKDGGPWHGLFTESFGNGGFFKEGWTYNDVPAGNHYNIGGYDGEVVYAVMTHYIYQQAPAVELKNALLDAMR